MNNKDNEASAIFDAYKVISEATKTQKDPKAKQGLKPGTGAKPLPKVQDEPPTQPFAHKGCAADNCDGMKKDIVDPKTIKPGKSIYEPEKFSNTIGKNVKESINISMKNSKSVFDKLYEQVMGEGDLDQLDAQQLGVGPEAGAEGDMGDTESSEAEKSPVEILQDIIDDLSLLKDKLSGGEEGSDEGSDEGSSDEASDEAGAPSEDNEEEEEDDSDEEEDNQEVASEAIDAQEIGTPVSGTVRGGQPTPVKGQANVVKGTVTGGAKAGKAGDGKVTDKVGNDGEKGHALVGSGVSGGAPTSVKGKANVVNSRIKGNNQDAFNV